MEAALDLPVKSGVKLVFPLRGEAPAAPEVERRQFFARGVLRKVAPGGPAAFTVKVDGPALGRSRAAWLRAVLEGSRGAGGRVRVNGAALDLPDYDWVCDVPLDPKALKAENDLVFEAGESGRSYRVCAASLILELPAQGKAD
jgi:hypothetical protein